MMLKESIHVYPNLSAQCQWLHLSCGFILRMPIPATEYRGIAVACYEPHVCIWTERREILLKTGMPSWHLWHSWTVWIVMVPSAARPTDSKWITCRCPWLFMRSSGTIMLYDIQLHFTMVLYSKWEMIVRQDVGQTVTSGLPQLTPFHKAWAHQNIIYLSFSSHPSPSFIPAMFGKAVLTRVCI